MRLYAALQCDDRPTKTESARLTTAPRSGRPVGTCTQRRKLVYDGGVSESSAVSPALREVLLRRRRAKPRKPTFETSGEVG